MIQVHAMQQSASEWRDHDGIFQRFQGDVHQRGTVRDEQDQGQRGDHPPVQREPQRRRGAGGSVPGNRPRLCGLPGHGRCDPRAAVRQGCRAARPPGIPGAPEAPAAQPEPLPLLRHGDGQGRALLFQLRPAHAGARPRDRARAHCGGRGLLPRVRRDAQGSGRILRGLRPRLQRARRGGGEACSRARA